MVSTLGLGHAQGDLGAQHSRIEVAWLPSNDAATSQMQLLSSSSAREVQASMRAAGHPKSRYLKLLFYGSLDRWAGIWTTVRTEQGVCQLL